MLVRETDCLVDSIAPAGAGIVVAPKRDRRIQRPWDADLHKERNRTASSPTA